MNEIRIPLLNDEGSSEIHLYPDELPEDPNELIDVLRAELAPFKVWRSCALEYHRQDLNEQFDMILNEIVGAIQDPEIDTLYKEREDYTEGITEIYLALAAKSLGALSDSSTRSGGGRAPDQQAQEQTAQAKKVIEWLARADDKMRINEYTWLIKGFYEILQGEPRRAEDRFRSVHDRATKGQGAQGQLKKKFLFGALVGLGIVAYGAQQYAQALEHLSRAVQTNPQASGVTVRMAVACCCFKLEQFERARLALEKCFSLDPANAKLLLLMALVELVRAQKDRAERSECRRRALEYSVLAHAVDPSNAQALNLLANHHFHAWKRIDFKEGCYILDASHLLLPTAAAGAVIVAGNRLTINLDASVTHSIEAVSSNAEGLTAIGRDILQLLLPGGAEGGPEGGLVAAGFVLVALNPPIPQSKLPEAAGGSCSAAGAGMGGGLRVNALQVRELAAVERFARQALACTTDAAVRAESHYMLAKVAHSQRDLNSAFEHYFKALKDAPDMALSAFGAAQILFLRQEFPASLELFEKVLLKHPEDKDTQAYVLLLRTFLRSDKASFDKLKEVAPGFQYEVDLWLAQGRLRQGNPEEHAEALRCYVSAKECVEQRQANGELGVAPMPAEVLSNISVLSHSLGKLSVALEYSRKTLASFRKEGGGSTGVEGQPVFCSAELEGVYYCWSNEPLCSVTMTTGGNEEAGRFVVRGAGCKELVAGLAVGEEVLIHDIKHSVVEVSVSPAADEAVVTCTSPVKLQWVLSAEARESSLSLRVKQSFFNFTDDTVVYSYNFARLLEDDGHTQPAAELYIELLKRHPSFIECYLRLSLISCDAGKIDEASVWLSRALGVNPGDAEALLCLGDLYTRSNNLEDAKRCYERNCTQDKHDARSLLSLGNFYFWVSMSGGTEAQSKLKESYKFFFNVLRENARNAYAANGLAMVCVQKGEIDAAKEIFTKAREANVELSEHISTNLAHLLLMQNRNLDAERLYQATCRGLSQSAAAHAGGRSVADKAAYLYECTAHAQMRTGGRAHEALTSLLRSAHLNPVNMRVWYNTAVVGKTGGDTVLRGADQRQCSVAEITEAQQVLALARRLFVHLGAVQFGKRTAPYDKQLAASRGTKCSDMMKLLEERLYEAQEAEALAEDERRRQEEEHHERMRRKQEEQERREQEEEKARRELQLRAELKDAKLQGLRESWKTSQPPPAAASAAATAGEAESGAAGGKGGKGRSGRRKAAQGSKSKKKSRGGRDSDEEGGGGGVLSSAESEQEEDEEDRLLRQIGEKEGDLGLVGSALAPGGMDASLLSGRKRPQRTAAAPRDYSDVFGEDSEDEDGGSGAAAVTAEGPGASASKRARTGALKTATGAGANDNDDDDDDLFGGSDEEEPSGLQVGAANTSKSNGQTRKQQRVIDSSDDEF